MIRALTVLLAAAMLLGAGSAEAEEYQVLQVREREKPPLIPWDVSFEAELGSAFGATQIGTKTFAQALGAIGGRVTVGRVSLVTGYQMGSTHRSQEGGDTLLGSTHRFSLAVALEAHEFGSDLLGGETTVGIGVGRQYIHWDQGDLSRRDVFLFVEQAMRVSFLRSDQREVVRAPRSLLQSFRLQLIASRTPPFAIAPVSATRGPRSETDIGFLAGFVLRFRN